MAQDNNMTNENLAKALKVLRSFNGAYDEYADEIERLQRQLNFANREPPHCSTCSCGQHEPLPCPSVHDHMWAEDGHCMRCYAQKSGVSGE